MPARRHGESLGEALRRERAGVATKARCAIKAKHGPDLMPYLPDSLQVPELSVLENVRPVLPVMKHKEEIVRSVKENRVTVISGDTGCGKSTQVPQFLLDDPAVVPEEKIIVVTQPRRIACITIAMRVALERGEACGESVGYQIRFVDQTSPRTRLVFCTTAVMTRKLHNDPFFSKVAVLVLDEVHERDTETEFLLVALRERILAEKMNVKIVLMSATLSTDTFIDYFSDLRMSWAGGTPPDPDPRSYVAIVGRLFEVKEHYLEDALEWTGAELPDSRNASTATTEALAAKLADTRDGKVVATTTLKSLAVYGEHQVYLALIKSLVLFLDAKASAHGDKCRGAILVFLPGWAAISALHGMLRPESSLYTLPLHSQLSPEEQQLVFEAPPRGRRKVVLSTNLAETSVTVDDAVYVINSGVLKERVFDPDRQIGRMAAMPNTWANATQRAGRVGRTQEGVVVHLFPSWKMAELKRWPTPQILSTSLEEVVLQLLALGLGDPFDVLAKSPSAPSEQSIAHALWLLQEMGLVQPQYSLDSLPQDSLLPLGRWVATIPLHPMAAKAIVYGCMFGTLLPVAATIAFLNLKSPFAKAWPGEESLFKGGKEALARGCGSDHYAAAVAYLDWRARVATGDSGVFVEEHCLSRETLDMADQLVRSLMLLMVNEYGYDGADAAFIHDADSGSWDAKAIFEDPGVWQFCKAALCGAYVPFFAHRKGAKLESDCGEEVNAHGSSVLARSQPLRNPYAATANDWVVYSDCMKMSRVSLMESTIVSSNHVLLFSKAVKPAQEPRQPGEIELDGWRGTLHGGEAAIRDLQKARHALSHLMRKAQERKLASVMDTASLDRIASFLQDSRFTLKSVSGLRELVVGEREMSTIFVGNVPPQADDSEIRRLFGMFGTVIEVDLVCEMESGKRRGFGFVVMSSREEAARATQALQGEPLHESKLRLECKAISAGSPGAWKDGGRAGDHSGAASVKPPKRNWLGMPGHAGNSNKVAAILAQRAALKGGIVAQKMHEAALREQRLMAKRRRLSESGMKEEDVDDEVDLVAHESRHQVEDRQLRKKAKEEVAKKRQEGLRLKQAPQIADLMRPPGRRVYDEVLQEGDEEEDAAGATQPVLCGSRRSSGSSGSCDGGTAMQRWSTLLLECARVRIAKKAAAAEEDFKEAARLKEREQLITAEAQELRDEAMHEGASPEMASLERAKKQAAEEENYELAAKLKTKLERLVGKKSAASPLELERSAWCGAVELAKKEGGDQPLYETLHSLAPKQVQGAMAAVSSGFVGTFSSSLPVKEEIAEAHRPGKSRSSEADAVPVAPWLAAKQELQPEHRAQRAVRERAQVRAERERNAKRLKAEEGAAAGDEPEPAASPGRVETVDLDHGLDAEGLREMSTTDLWQRAWDMTWARLKDVGRGDDHAAIYAHAQRNWVAWLASKSGGILTVLPAHDGDEQASVRPSPVLSSTASPSPGVKMEKSEPDEADSVWKLLG